MDCIDAKAVPAPPVGAVDCVDAGAVPTPPVGAVDCCDAGAVPAPPVMGASVDWIDPTAEPAPAVAASVDWMDPATVPAAPVAGPVDCVEPGAVPAAPVVPPTVPKPEPTPVWPAGVAPETAPSPSVVESAFLPGEKAITSFAAERLLSAAALSMLGTVLGIWGTGCAGAWGWRTTTRGVLAG